LSGERGAHMPRRSHLVERIAKRADGAPPPLGARSLQCAVAERWIAARGSHGWYSGRRPLLRGRASRAVAVERRLLGDVRDAAPTGGCPSQSARSSGGAVAALAVAQLHGGGRHVRRGEPPPVARS